MCELCADKENRSESPRGYVSLLVKKYVTPKERCNETMESELA